MRRHLTRPRARAAASLVALAAVSAALAQSAAQTVEELDNHRIISFGEPVPSSLGDINYLERLGRPDAAPRRAAMRVNAILGMMQACRAGIGIALLPAFVEASIPDLQPLTASIEELVTPLWLVTHPELKDAARIQVLMRAFGPALANAANPLRALQPGPTV
mgnify:CR=1 FL=1